MVFLSINQHTKFEACSQRQHAHQILNVEDIIGAPKLKMGHVTLIRPISGVIGIHKQGLAMINLATKF